MDLKKCKLYLKVILGTLLWSKLSVSQTSTQVPKVVLPSPNVATLQRYGDIPISPYTGVPAISIPLYEIKIGSATVPISISYHASGIKVADEAGHVGLGWALNAGGVISRTVIGGDDFSASSGYHVTTSTADVTNGSSDFPSQSFLIQKDCGIAVSNIPNLRQDLEWGYSFQPDVYNFNFLNYSGKFFLKRNKEAILEKKEKIKITCLDVNASAWQVTTADGKIFRFQEYETYTEDGANPNLNSGLTP